MDELKRSLWGLASVVMVGVTVILVGAYAGQGWSSWLIAVGLVVTIFCAAMAFGSDDKQKRR